MPTGICLNARLIIPIRLLDASLGQTGATLRASDNLMCGMLGFRVTNQHKPHRQLRR
jgi:hypothetical protein